ATPRPDGRERGDVRPGGDRRRRSSIWCNRRGHHGHSRRWARGRAARRDRRGLRCVPSSRPCLSPLANRSIPAGRALTSMGQGRQRELIGCLPYAYLLHMPGAEREREQNIQLRLERERRGWSQKQVAVAIGTNAVMVSRWECGVMRPGPHFRQRLCSLYGRTPQELGFLAPTAAAPAVPAAAAPDTPPVWCVPLRPNRYFTGREEFLERLHDA